MKLLLHSIVVHLIVLSALCLIPCSVLLFVLCRLTAKNRDQLRNLTLGNRIRGLPLLFSALITPLSRRDDTHAGRVFGWRWRRCGTRSRLPRRRLRQTQTPHRTTNRTTVMTASSSAAGCSCDAASGTLCLDIAARTPTTNSIHTVKSRHRVCGHDTIAISWV